MKCFNIRILFILLCLLCSLICVVSASFASSESVLSVEHAELIERQKEIYEEEDFRLQASLDMLSSALSSLIDGVNPQAQQVLLQKSIKGILAKEEFAGYVSLWRGTVELYSPLTPDNTDLDFSNVYDLTGRYFVKDMLQKANNGGGFVEYAMNNYNATEWTLRRAYAVPIKGTDYWLMSWRILIKGKHAKVVKDDFLELLNQRLPSETQMNSRITSVDIRVNTLQKTVLKWFLFSVLLCFCGVVIFLAYRWLFKTSPFKNKE